MRIAFIALICLLSIGVGAAAEDLWTMGMPQWPVPRAPHASGFDASWWWMGRDNPIVARLADRAIPSPWWMLTTMNWAIAIPIPPA